MNECKNYEEFLKKYSNKNEKNKYFSIDKKGNIKVKKPSYILEAAYFYFKGFKECEKLIDFEEIITRKEKKIYRYSSVDIEKIKDRFFRALFNKNEIHSLMLANELIRKDVKSFFDIMYLNAKLSDDENRLIKIYLFELIFQDKGLILPLLSNLIRYFCLSKEGYGNLKKIDKLYSYIYEKKFLKKLDINFEITKENALILSILEGKKLC